MPEKKKNLKKGDAAVVASALLEPEMASGTSILFEEDFNVCPSATDMVKGSAMDPKPRLRWTAELHDRFVDAVSQLGGSESKFFHKTHRQNMYLHSPLLPHHSHSHFDAFGIKHSCKAGLQSLV
jgi:SHAQKYF class myb-like DNA-binding protein